MVLCAGAYAGYKAWVAERQRAQAVAMINGRAITRSEVEVEARVEGIDPAKLDHAAMRGMLDRVIERRLLADAAIAQGIADEPVIQAVRARSDEMVLAGVLSQRMMGQPKPVSDAEARQAMAAHPAMFSARQTYVVDRIVCPKDSLSEAMLAHVDTMDQVADFLNLSRVPVNRKVQLLDSASLPAPVASALGAIAPGKVFVLPQGQVEMIGTVIRRIPSALPDEAQLAAAREFIGKQQLQDRFKRALDQLRRRANITLRDQ